MAEAENSGPAEFDPESVPHSLAASLALDPGLALWAILKAWGQNDEPRAIPELAEWLFRNAVDELVWGDDETESLDGSSYSRFGALMEKSVRVAIFAADRYDPDSFRIDSPAYFLGLLHDYWKWLGPLTDQSQDQWAYELFPEWLASRIVMASPGKKLERRYAPVCLEVESLAHAIERNRRHGTQALGKKTLHEMGRAQIERSRRAWQSKELSACQALPMAAARARELRQARANIERQAQERALEMMAEFAAGAGHEMNNPLAVISGRAQLMSRDEPDPERRRELALFHAQALRVHEMIADMMLFARPPRPEPSLFDLGKIVQRLAGEAEEEATAKNAQIQVSRGTGPYLANVDPVQISVAFRLLIDNALNALPNGGRLWIDLSWSRSNESILIRFEDNGPGVPKEDLRKVLGPFYSGRSAGRGLGMGLSKCWRIVTHHGGTISVASEPGRGAIVTIELPAADAPEDE